MGFLSNINCPLRLNGASVVLPWHNIVSLGNLISSVLFFCACRNYSQLSNSRLTHQTPASDFSDPSHLTSYSELLLLPLLLFFLLLPPGAFWECGPWPVASVSPALVRNAEAPALLQTYCIQTCILTSSLHNSVHINIWDILSHYLTSGQSITNVQRLSLLSDQDTGLDLPAVEKHAMEGWRPRVYRRLELPLSIVCLPLAVIYPPTSEDVFPSILPWPASLHCTVQAFIFSGLGDCKGLLTGLQRPFSPAHPQIHLPVNPHSTPAEIP